jgi:aminoglycoside 3-N-acetyltransferase
MAKEPTDSSREVITKERIVNDLQELGVRRGDLLNVKVSLKSIGHVEGGAKTLIDALMEVIGPQGTIVTESFVRMYPLPLSGRNVEVISDRWTPSYAGALANAMIKYPGSHRSQHPVQKFSAVGALAEELAQGHTPDSYAYDVLRVMAENSGRNLKLGTDEKVVGVGTTHVAIGSLGFRQRLRRTGVNYLDDRERIVTFERNWAGICAQGLINFIPLYRDAGAILSEGKVGEADSKITDMKGTLEVERKKLSEDPTFFFCGDPSCEGCGLTWEFSSGSRAYVYFHSLKRDPKRFLKKRVREMIDLARAKGAHKAWYPG